MENIKDKLPAGHAWQATGRTETTQTQGKTTQGGHGYGTTSGSSGMHIGHAPEDAYAIGTTTAAGGTSPEVCGQEMFTKIEDRPVIIERKEFIMEHKPVEREYVIEMRATGVERPLPVSAEVIGVEEHVVKETPPSKPCEGL